MSEFEDSFRCRSVYHLGIEGGLRSIGGGLLTDAALCAAAPVLEYEVLPGSASAVDP